MSRPFRSELNENLLEQLKSIHPTLSFEKSQPFTVNSIITVTCPVHGDFEKRVLKMAYKPFQGCQKCGFGRRNNSREVTKELLVEAAKKHFGDHYDLTDTVMTGTKSKIMVKCKVHGEVSVSAGSFYAGRSGCKFCGIDKNREARITPFAEVMRQIKAIHGDKFQIDEKVYRGVNKRVPVVCAEHGEFRTVPWVLMKGSGCRKCGGAKMKETVRCNEREKFLKTLSAKYGDKFSTEKVDYVDIKSPVLLTCKDHGDFMVTPQALYKSTSLCPYCGKYKCPKEFLDDAETIHGKDRYTYEDYSTIKGKFGVTCNICGLKWWTTPRHILDGSGCPACAIKGFNPKAPASVYCLAFTLESGEVVYKVGITNNGIQSRIWGMGVKAGVQWETLSVKSFSVGRDAFEEEQRLHKLAKKYKYKGERFLKNGWNELFTVNPCSLTP